MQDGNYWSRHFWPRAMRRRLSRRGLIRVSALGAAGALSTAYLGCGDNQEGNGGAPSAKPTSGGTAPAGTPRPGGTFTLAMAAAFSSMDPTYLSIGQDRICMYNVYDAPVIRDMNDAGDLVLLPSLGESWEWVDDTHLSMTWRTDVKFHDGTDFNAGAVKFYFDRILNPDTQSSRRNDYKMLDHVEQQGDTITYVLKFKNALFVSALMGWGASIPSPTAIQKYGNDFRNNPVGSGAFMFKRQEPGVEWEFVKNPNYWRKGEPLLDGFKVRVFADKAVCAAALKAGEVDMASQGELDSRDIAGFEEDPDFNVLVGGAVGLAQFFINKSRPPGDNLHLRKAISLAINREEFVAKYNGYAFISPGPLPRRGPWDNPDEPDPEFNIEKAKEEMKQAGLEDGITLNFYATNDPAAESDTELLQAQLSEIGVNLKVEFIALPVAAVKLNAGEFDFAYGTFGAALGDIDYEMETIFQTGGFFNGGATSDPEIDRLVDLGKNTQPDFADRRATYWEIMKIVNEDAYSIYVVGFPEVAVMRKNLHGYIPSSEPGGPGYEVQYRGYWLS